MVGASLRPAQCPKRVLLRCCASRDAKAHPRHWAGFRRPGRRGPGRRACHPVAQALLRRPFARAAGASAIQTMSARARRDHMCTSSNKSRQRGKRLRTGSAKRPIGVAGGVSEGVGLKGSACSTASNSKSRPTPAIDLISTRMSSSGDPRVLAQAASRFSDVLSQTLIK
jgi:hypothetical protein